MSYPARAEGLVNMVTICILMQSVMYLFYGGAHGVMVIIAGNGHGFTSSNPWWDWLYFT